MRFALTLGISDNKDEIMEFAGCGLTKEFYHLVDGKMNRITLEGDQIVITEINDPERIQAWEEDTAHGHMDDYDYFDSDIFVPEFISESEPTLGAWKKLWKYERIELEFALNENSEYEYTVMDLNDGYTLTKLFLDANPEFSDSSNEQNKEDYKNFQSYISFFQKAIKYKFPIHVVYW